MAAQFNPDEYLANKSNQGFDPDTYLESKKTPSGDSGGGILDTIGKVASKIDSYTGAPTRSAISAAQDGKNPISAFSNQFGSDPKLAPTGEDIAVKAGMSTQGAPQYSPTFMKNGVETQIPGSLPSSQLPSIKSPASLAGMGIDIAADPTLLIPFGAVGKGLAKGAGAGLEVLGKGARILPGAAKVETVGKVVKEGVENSAQAIKKMFSPSQATDFKELSEIAAKHGIDPKLLPEAVEFGENSVITRAARNRAEGPLGEAYLKKHEAAVSAVQDATEKKISDIAGGSVPSAVEAGEILRDGYDKGIDKVFDSVGMTHNKVLEAMPGLKLSPEAFSNIESKLSSMEKWAKGREMRGFTNAQRAQGTQVLRALDAVRESNGSYKQALEALRDIGDVAFKSKNILADVPPDITKFRELYNTLNDGLIDTVRVSAGEPVAKELVDSNKIITELMGDKSTVAGVIGNKNLAPEKVFSALIENGDTTKLQALKRILPPEYFQKLKGSFLESQIKRASDGSFTFKSLQNNLGRKKNILGTIFDPSEIKDISELIRLGDRFGNPVLSTSGTGASGLFSDIGKGVRSGIENDTVIGYLKDAARNKQIAGPAQSQGPGLIKSAVNAATNPQFSVPIKTASKEISVGSNIDDKLKKLAAISPTAVRILGGKSQSNSGGGSSPKLKGESLWAVNGFNKIIQNDPNGILSNPRVVEKLMSSPQGKQLLIFASSLKPGSKAMENILQKIKSQFGELQAYNEGGYVTKNSQQPVADDKKTANIDPDRAKAIQEGMRKAFHFDKGGSVPGVSRVHGNSPRNDTVLAKLSPGEVVLPLSIMQSSNPAQKAKEFVEQLLKHRSKTKIKSQYGGS